MLARILLTGVTMAATCFAQAAQPKNAANLTFQTLVREAKSRIKEMNPEQLKALAASNEKYALIDVREDNEWVSGHAAGAIHISRGLLEKDIETKIPAKNAKIILYCHAGNRSALAADTLQKMGYSNVYSLAGGFTAYQSLGLPVEK